MAFSDWRPRRIVVLCAGWVLFVVGAAILRAILFARTIERERNFEELSIGVHIPGGAWLVVGPPLLLLAVWWWSRRSRPR